MDNEGVFQELPAGLYIPLCKKAWNITAASTHSGFFHINLVKKRVKLNPTVPDNFPNPRKVQVTSLSGRTSCEIKQGLVMRETGGDTVQDYSCAPQCMAPMQGSLRCSAPAAQPWLPGRCAVCSGAACSTQPQLSSPGVGSTALPVGVWAGRDWSVLHWELGALDTSCSEPAAGFAMCDCAFF